MDSSLFSQQMPYCLLILLFNIYGSDNNNKKASYKEKTRASFW